MRFVRGWVLVWCVQAYAWAWDAPAAMQPAGYELAPNPYLSPIELAPDPYPAAGDDAAPPPVANRRPLRAHVAARLAPSPYEAASASLAPMPYAGRMPERELAQPSSQPLTLAASPYEGPGTPALAPDPY